MSARVFRLATAASLIAFALVLAPTPAIADGVYHSEHLDLVPVREFPLRSGFVQNIHANGPIIFAHENYVLNGAAPDTTFDVYLLVHIDELCSIRVDELPTATVTTNGAGNGKAQAIFSPEMAPHDMSIYLQWEFRTGETPAYRTECTLVVLD